MPVQHKTGRSERVFIGSVQRKTSRFDRVFTGSERLACVNGLCFKTRLEQACVNGHLLETRPDQTLVFLGRTVGLVRFGISYYALSTSPVLRNLL